MTELPHDQDRVRAKFLVRQAESLPRQYPGDLLRLGRKKSQPILRVTPHQPTNRSVAQSALTIEDDQQPTTEFCNVVHHQRDADGEPQDSIWLMRDVLP